MTILIDILSTPERIGELSITQWQELLAQADVSQLVGRLSYLVELHNIAIPESVKWHLSSATKIANKQKQQAIQEFLEVSKSVRKINAKLVLLKGATYIAKKLPCAHGRTFSDIDILVNKSNLEQIEMILKFSGWIKTEIEDYDEKYYRTWMHEIPPLVHIKRGSVLDVHHNILPLTNKYTPNAESFDIDSVYVEGVGNINTLSDIDLCIHNAVHLFTESEFHHGLRDLSDFDLLLRHFQKSNIKFVNQLIVRSKELGLFDYTRLAIRYSHLTFNTPIGSTLLQELQNKSLLHDHFQDFCFQNLFIPNHGSCRTWKFGLATWLLYWRGHLIRMPLRLLIPHLCRKSFKRGKDFFQKEEPDTFLP